MTKYMKDIIPIGCHRQYKRDFLNRLVALEEQREILYKQFVANGMRHYEAYQESIRRLSMKELIQITDAEFALLCYIKEVARERVNGMDHYYEQNDAIVDVINILLDAYCAVEESE